jgi:hypothetical protein
MAQGDAINFYKVGLVNNGTLDIKPGADQGASGDQWSIHELYVGAACSIFWTNGAQTITIAAPTAAKWITNLFSHCTGTNFIRIQNTSGGAADFGYSGIQTK